MTPAVTQDPEVAEMMEAARLAQLPSGMRTFWPFPQVMAPGKPFCETPAVPNGCDETSGMPCRCGFGEPVARSQTGAAST